MPAPVSDEVADWDEGADWLLGYCTSKFSHFLYLIRPARADGKILTFFTDK
jgi:hypothetical protein